MRVERKQRLKKKVQKEARQEAHKYEMFDRILTFLDLQDVFARCPDRVYEMFLERIAPGVEVHIVGDPSLRPDIEKIRREVATTIRRPRVSSAMGRRYYLSFEDMMRVYGSILVGIDFLAQQLRGHSRPELCRIGELMQEASDRCDRIDPVWIDEVYGNLMFDIVMYASMRYRVDRPLIEMRLEPATKREGGYCEHLELRIHPAEPRVIAHRGARWTVHPCRRPHGFEGLRQIRWNCQKLGIEGPNVDLPVMISDHALDRLHERLNVGRLKEGIHTLMFESLSNPVFRPQDIDEYLVDMRMGQERVGYFVAKILPQAVVIRTFLFLTMTGTPEGDALRNLLGLSRTKVEEYKLDEFHTLIGSDLIRDPLLSKIIHTCGCGHLLEMIDCDPWVSWTADYGNRLKEELGVREAVGGFKIGQKWVRWNDPVDTELVAK